MPRVLFTEMRGNTLKSRRNEHLYNKVLGIKNYSLYLSNSRIYEKEPRYKETSLSRSQFASPLALHYIEVPLSGTVIPGSTSDERISDQCLRRCHTFINPNVVMKLSSNISKLQLN